jgi:uncharacterized protein YqgC (DUF456 family)
MPHVLALILLAVGLLLGLMLVPLGLPGLWVMVLALVGYGGLTDFRTVGAVTLGIAAGLALLGDVVETWVGARYAAKFGGSRRAGWGALLGGVVGAMVGVPVPLVGSLIGSLVGSFVGAATFEYAHSVRAGGAIRAGVGALIGRTWAAAVKMAFGMAIATFGVVAAIRG